MTTSEELKFLMTLFERIQELKKHCPTDPNLPEIEKIFFRFFNEKNAFSTAIKSIKTDTTQIREHLEIRGEQSIDYSFIPTKNLSVKNQLIKDNLRMENSRLDLNEKNDLARFYNFCVNALFQIEELINFYYQVKYDKIADLLSHLESVDGKFKRKIETSIADISLLIKIGVFNKTVLSDRSNKNVSITINQIRITRNEEMHRCSVIEVDENVYEKYLELREKQKKYNVANKSKGLIYSNTPAEWDLHNKGTHIEFLRRKDFNLVRETIRTVSARIQNELSKI